MLQFTITPIARWLASGLVLAMLAGCGPGGENTLVEPPTGGGQQPANRAPTISGNGAATLVVANPYSFTPTASDPDGDTLSFTITGKPAWATFSSTTGALSGTPSAAQAGVYNVTISVSDGSLQASMSFAITVNPAPSPPPPTNAAPTISGAGGATLNVGATYDFTPTATDPDGNPLVFSVTGAPSWATFNSMNGRLSGSASAAGTSNVTITVSDGALTARLAFTITVQQPNRAPTISGNGSRTVAAGTAYSFTPTASDPDGNRLTFSVTGKPAWLAFNTATGALTGTPAATDAGTSAMTITVSDGTLTATLGVTVTVSAAATGSATLSWTPPTTRTDGSTLSNLQGYRIYYGTSAGSLTNRVDLTNPSLSTYMIENLAAGTWYFAATAVDSAGVESSLTPTVSKTIS